MPSDTRASCRQIVSFSVQLKTRERQAIECSARNLSVEGMLLEMGPVILSIGDQVDLTISLKEGVFSVPAVVLHSNSDCTGIMFCHPQPALYRIIAQPMRYAHMPISSRMALAKGALNSSLPKGNG